MEVVEEVEEEVEEVEEEVLISDGDEATRHVQTQTLAEPTRDVQTQTVCEQAFLSGWTYNPDPILVPCQSYIMWIYHSLIQYGICFSM